MIPRDTVYRLAHSPKDYSACRALLREQGVDVRLSFPTVVAERSGHVIGFVATQPRKDAVVAGPLMVSTDLPRPGIVAMRLAEAYENVLRAAGITVYLFHVERANQRWSAILAKLRLTRYAEDETGTFYRRSLQWAS